MSDDVAEVIDESAGRSVRLDGKVALVTGAGGGIGREIAIALARAGAAVIVNDIGVSLEGSGGSVSPARETVDKIVAEGGRAEVSADSVADWESAGRIVACAVETFGRIDVVVNNAGIVRDQIFHKMNPEDWRAVIDVHLNGSFYVSRRAAEHFRAQGSGSFIHMTSTSGLIGNLGQASYGAAKLGITAMSKIIALDMARFGVRSNCIAPVAWSRMTNSIPGDTPQQRARIARLQMMHPSKNAPLAVFLASDQAAGITGQVFGSRNNELYLFSQNRLARAVHRDGGWTPETIAEHAIPTLKGSFLPLDRASEVFSWDPV